MATKAKRSTKATALTKQERADMQAMVVQLLGKEKAGVWWITLNPMMGDVAPIVLSVMSPPTQRRLYKYIKNARDNMPKALHRA